MTLEISTVLPFDCPQQWAAALADADFRGLFYFVRHDPSAMRGLGVFGPEGQREAWATEDELP